MCYPSPGPRCSDHASTKLKVARAALAASATAKNQQNLTDAEAAYALTPMGIKELRSLGMSEVDGGNVERGVRLMKDADMNEVKRNRLISASNFLQTLTNYEAVMNAAEDTETPADVLTHLAHDDSYSGRNKQRMNRALALNPASPSEALSHLAEDSGRDVRASVAWHANTPVDVLTRLADDKSPSVRERAAQNPNTPVDVLTRLAKDEQADVRGSVGWNLKTPVDLLTHLAKDRSFIVREDVASNPSLPVPVLLELAHDADSDVRAEAQTRLFGKPNVIASLLGMEDDVPTVETLLRDHPTQLKSMLGWR